MSVNTCTWRHFRLGAVPFGESVDLAQIVGIGDAAVAARVEAVLQGFHAGEVLDDEVRITPELVALVQVSGPVVRQLDARHAGHQGDREGGHAPEQERAARHHEGAQAIEEGGTPCACGAPPQRQDRQQRRQQRHGIHVGDQHADGHQVAEDPERRRVRGVHAEEPDHRRGRREEHRPGIVAQRFGDGRVPVQTLAHAGVYGADDVDRVADGEGHDDEGNAGVGGVEHQSGPADDAHGGGDDEDKQGDDAQRAEQGAQEEGADQDDDQEGGGCEDPHIVLGRLRQDLVYEDIAGDVIVDIRMGGPRLVQEAAQIVVSLDLRGVRMLGQGEADHQSGNPPVAGDETAGDAGLA